MSLIEIVRNDKNFYLRFTIQDADGVAVDLTNATVRFKMVSIGGTVNKVNGVCVLDDAVNGSCSYLVQAEDTDTIGFYNAELELTYSGGKLLTAILENVQVFKDCPT